MSEYNSICIEQGQLIIKKKNFIVGIDSAIQTYHFQDAESLFNVAKGFPEIIRPGSKKEKGGKYTLRKARKDFLTL
jgi:hypothetical protein